MAKTSSVAVFIDVENIHYSTLNHYSETPDWSCVVDACKAYGRIASIQAFGDWISFAKEVPEIQKNGIQPVFVPLSQDGKSSLDCYLTVSAMKLFFQNHTLDTLILASGDRDYIPLIAELKALGKQVIILAVPCTLSKDLTRIVDGVIEYKPAKKTNSIESNHGSVDTTEANSFVVSVLRDLEQQTEGERWVNLASIGLELKKRNRSFTHKDYGYDKLSEMLESIPNIEVKYDNYEKGVALARCLDGDAIVGSDVFQGVILNVRAGYGFIRPDDDESDNLFFHYSAVLDDGFESLYVGDRVSYRRYHTEKGESAEQVQKIA